MDITIAKILKKEISGRILLSPFLSLFYYLVISDWLLPYITQTSLVMGIVINAGALIIAVWLDFYWKLRITESEHDPARIEERARKELPTYALPVIIIWPLATAFANGMGLAMLGSLVIYGIADFIFNVFIFPRLGNGAIKSPIADLWMGWLQKTVLFSISTKAMIAAFLAVARLAYLIVPSLGISLFFASLTIYLWYLFDPKLPSLIDKNQTPDDIARMAKRIRKQLGIKKDWKSIGVEMECKFAIDAAQEEQLDEKLRKIENIKPSAPLTTYQYLDTPYFDLATAGVKLSIGHKRNGQAKDQLTYKGKGILLDGDLTVRPESNGVDIGNEPEFSGGDAQPYLRFLKKKVRILMDENLRADVVALIDRTQAVVRTPKKKFTLELSPTARLEFSLDLVEAVPFENSAAVLPFPIPLNESEAASQQTFREFEIELVADTLEEQVQYLPVFKEWKINCAKA